MVLAFFVIDIVLIVLGLMNFSMTLILLSIFISFVLQIIILKEFSVVKKILICIGNIVLCVASYHALLSLTFLINPPGSQAFSALGYYVGIMFISYINFCIVYPILLIIVNKLKEKETSIFSYIFVILIYILITFGVELLFTSGALSGIIKNIFYLLFMNK